MRRPRPGSAATYTITPVDDQRDARQLLPLPQRHHVARLRHGFRRAARHPQYRQGQHAAYITGIPNVANPSLNVEETFNYKEDISKLTGKHAFKFGYELMRLRRNNYSVDNNAGTFTLAGDQRTQRQRHQHPEHRRQRSSAS